MWKILETIRKSKDVLGLNHRNAEYLRPFNKASSRRVADDKLYCKKILTRHGIPTAEIYKVVRNHKQLTTLDWDKLPKSFALKPNIGTGGSGIIVFYGKKKNSNEWIKPDGSTMTIEQIRSHIANILDGQYSMGNRHDIAIIEERIVNDPFVKPYAYKGVPDIRIIVFNKVPIMAELRLPTYESNGVANLHAGGIGVGIDIATGITTIAIHRRGVTLFDDIYDIIETTLDEQHLPLRGIQIPRWKEILKISIRCQEVTKLGYLGADIALDRYKGPVVFELNARSGLAIQIANLSGLRSRLERVKGLKIKDADHGIRVAQNLFGGEIEDEVKAVSGRQIIGLVEKAVVLLPTAETETSKTSKTPQKPTEYKCKVQVNTGARKSRITPHLALRIGYKGVLDFFKTLNIPDKFDSFEAAATFIEQNKSSIEGNKQLVGLIAVSESGQIKVRPMVQMTLVLADTKIDTSFIISGADDSPYPVTIGREELSNFLVDTSKTFILH